MFLEPDPFRALLVFAFEERVPHRILPSNTSSKICCRRDSPSILPRTDPSRRSPKQPRNWHARPFCCPISITQTSFASSAGRTVASNRTRPSDATMPTFWYWNSCKKKHWTTGSSDGTTTMHRFGHSTSRQTNTRNTPTSARSNNCPSVSRLRLLFPTFTPRMWYTETSSRKTLVLQGTTATPAATPTTPITTIATIAINKATVKATRTISWSSSWISGSHGSYPPVDVCTHPILPFTTSRKRKMPIPREHKTSCSI